MDALKKAEAEKKRVAARQEQSEPDEIAAESKLASATPKIKEGIKPPMIAAESEPAPTTQHLQDNDVMEQVTAQEDVPAPITEHLQDNDVMEQVTAQEDVPAPAPTTQHLQDNDVMEQVTAQEDVPAPTTQHLQDNDVMEKVALSLEPITSLSDEDQTEQHEAATDNDAPSDALESESETVLDEQDLPVIDERQDDTPDHSGVDEEASLESFEDLFQNVTLRDDKAFKNLDESSLKITPLDESTERQFQPTDAGNLFASSHQKTGRNPIWMISILIVAVVVVAIALLAFYYFNNIPIKKGYTSFPTQNNVGNIPSSADVAPLSQDEIATPQTELTTGAVESDFALSDATTSQATDTVESLYSATESVTEAIDANATDETVIIIEDVIPATPADTVEPTVTKSVVTADEFALDDAPVDVQTTQSSLLPDETIAPEAITVESTFKATLSLSSVQNSPKQIAARNVLLGKAFKAYQAGQFEHAKSFYQEILKSDPNHRDAYLGLAANAMSHHDQPLAYQYYARLLELDPEDVVAQNGLISLSNNVSAVANESAIKVLLSKAVNAPYLYFSLGNLYAKQKRWASAQQAFFNAYQHDPSNPDYAVNLAISFDQLGQYAVALEFYKTVLSLVSNRQNLQFDIDAIQKRIKALEKIGAPNS